jgi:predicted NAD/FAD-binding protein
MHRRQNGRSNASAVPEDNYSNPGRRDVLRAFFAAAGLPAIGAAAAAMRKVAIVGGGMAGVSLAWLLDGHRDVVLLESGDSVGGNVRTVAVELDGHSFQVDMGAQFFHPGPYPLYVKLLQFLGLYPSATDTRAFPASITVHADSEPLPRFISPVLPNRAWPLLAPWNWAGLQAFGAAFAAAKTREQQQGSWTVTLEDWVSTLGLSTAQRERMLFPWAASLFSGSIAQARGLSARAAMIFAAKALPDNQLDPILYYVLNRGMAEPLHRMLQQTTSVQVITGARVTNVTRDPQGGFRLDCANGQSVVADELVFAAPAESCLTLIHGMPGTAAQQFALQGIQFHDSRLMLHTDPAYAPTDPNYRSFLNCRVNGEHCEASMWMAQVLAGPAQTTSKLWKSWVTHRDRLPNQILHEVQFRHMLPTVGSIVAQAALSKLQGLGGLWFAGGYTLPYDSQETALLSAINIAWKMQVASARAGALQAQ